MTHLSVSSLHNVSRNGAVRWGGRHGSRIVNSKIGAVIAEAAVGEAVLSIRAGGLGSVPYDAEGVRTVPHDLVRDGVLESYVLSTYSARKLGLKTTGNAGGVHNLIITPGDLDLQVIA